MVINMAVREMIAFRPNLSTVAAVNTQPRSLPAYASDTIHEQSASVSEKSPGALLYSCKVGANHPRDDPSMKLIKVTGQVEKVVLKLELSIQIRPEDQNDSCQNFVIRK